MRWVAGLTLLAACSTGAAGEPTPDVQPRDDGGWGRIEAEWTGDGPKVGIIGDSLAHQARPHLHALLDGYSVRIDAYVGEGWVPGIMSAGGDLIEDAAVDIAADEPEIIVWVLGTNDAWHPDRPLDEALADIDEMADRFGRSCIVAVEVNEQATADGFDPGKARAINDRLRRHADVLVTPDVSLLQDDGIHARRPQRRAWAEQVAGGVEECG